MHQARFLNSTQTFSPVVGVATMAAKAGGPTPLISELLATFVGPPGDSRTSPLNHYQLRKLNVKT